MKFIQHELDECMLVFYGSSLDSVDTVSNGEEICEQGYADLKFNGINKTEARRVWRR